MEAMKEVPCRIRWAKETGACPALAIPVPSNGDVSRLHLIPLEYYVRFSVQIAIDIPSLVTGPVDSNTCSAAMVPIAAQGVIARFPEPYVAHGPVCKPQQPRAPGEKNRRLGDVLNAAGNAVNIPSIREHPPIDKRAGHVAIESPAGTYQRANEPMKADIRAAHLIFDVIDQTGLLSNKLR